MTIKTIIVQAKHDDRYSATIIRDDGSDYDYDGYGLPLKGFGSGDYIDVAIDNATGQIIGWVPFEDSELEEFVRG